MGAGTSVQFAMSSQLPVVAFVHVDVMSAPRPSDAKSVHANDASATDAKGLTEIMKMTGWQSLRTDGAGEAYTPVYPAVEPNFGPRAVLTAGTCRRRNADAPRPSRASLS